MNSAAPRQRNEGLQTLSEREKETLRRLVAGHDIKSIAADLDLSVNTVNERLREARRKLGASSSRQAARLLAEAEMERPNFSGQFSVRPNLSADKETGVETPAAGRPSDEHSNRTPGKGHTAAWLAGGMLVMSLIIAAAVVSLVAEAGNPPQATPIASAAPSTSASANSALQWLALMDGRQWQEGWNTAGAMFRSQISPEQWASKVSPVRDSFGPVSSRVLQTVTKATSLPGAPDGQYEILQVRTSFARKPDAIETVTLAREPSGWRVDGYFIK